MRQDNKERLMKLLYDKIKKMISKDDTEYKQVILIRSDLKLPKGKAVAQGAHAAVQAALRADKDLLTAWTGSGMAKIVVKVDDKDMLLEKVRYAQQKKIPTSVITDAGRTVVAPGTVTCAAIGPAKGSLVDSITSDLKLY